MKLEYRTAQIEDVTGPGVSGYAATWWDVDSWWSAMKPGAFRKTIKERGDRIPVLWNHNDNVPIGRVTEIKEDKRGLFFSAEFVEKTQYGAETLELLRAGVPLGISFGFETLKSRQGTDEDPIEFSNDLPYVRDPKKLAKADITVKEEIRLWEVSPVTFPANEQTQYTDIRNQGDLALIHHLIREINEGRALAESEVAALAELAAAIDKRAQPEPEPTTPLTDTRSRQRTVEVTLALATSRGWLGAQV